MTTFKKYKVYQFLYTIIFQNNKKSLQRFYLATQTPYMMDGLPIKYFTRTAFFFLFQY